MQSLTLTLVKNKEGESANHLADIPEVHFVRDSSMNLAHCVLALVQQKHP